MPPPPLRRPPGPLVAYLPDASPEHLAEYLVAFANSDGGTIIVGLDERGRTINRVYAEELEGGLEAAGRLCRPAIVTGWEQMESSSASPDAFIPPCALNLHAFPIGESPNRAGSENR